LDISTHHKTADQMHLMYVCMYVCIWVAAYLLATLNKVSNCKVLRYYEAELSRVHDFGGLDRHVLTTLEG
jgi:hypothetical protein